MLFHVRMDISLPVDMPEEVANEIKAREKVYSQNLQKEGKWLNVWRIVGEYANISIFNVESNAALHTILSGLPLFPFMTIKVTPMCGHPSSIASSDD